MDMCADKVEVAIEELKDAAPSDDGSSVVLETESIVDGSLHDTSIEVKQEDVPAVAVALLNSDAGESPSAADVPPAIRCLGAGVVHSVGASTVRLHLQFDSGQVLPIEMSKEAAVALCRGLFENTGASTGFDPVTWGVGQPAAKPGAAS